MIMRPPIVCLVGPDSLKVGDSSTMCMFGDTRVETWPPQEVTIQVKLTQYSPRWPSNNGKGEKEVEQRSLVDLSRLLAHAEGDATTADANIVSKDGMSYPAHRMILSGRSPVFRTMFQTTMKETISGVIECEDISGKCLKVLLHFLYTGKLAEAWKDADVLWELTYAAEKYQVKDLLDFLDANMGAMCRPQEAPTFLILANKFSLKNAEKDLFDFIKKSATKADDFVATMESLMMRFGTKSS